MRQPLVVGPQRKRVLQSFSGSRVVVAICDRAVGLPLRRGEALAIDFAN
jgi:hypothetical protein